jgi:hypothetical protein
MIDIGLKDVIFIIIIILLLYKIYLVEEKADSGNSSNIGTDAIENFGGTGASIEALQNLASMYESGDFKVTNLEVTGESTLNGDVTMNGNTTIKGNGTIEGNALIKGTGTINGKSYFKNESNFYNNVRIIGAKSLYLNKYRLINGNWSDNALYMYPNSKKSDKLYVIKPGAHFWMPKPK